MIMLLTYRSELREQLNKAIQDKGHETCIPAHRQDVLVAIKDRHPELIVLDLYLSEPSGIEVLRSLRQAGYHGRIIVLSGESMVSVLHDAQPLGLDTVVHIPARIGEHFDFGELEVAIETALRCHEREHHHARIARRAHELYQDGGRHDGRDIQDWLRAERELAS